VKVAELRQAIEKAKKIPDASAFWFYLDGWFGSDPADGEIDSAKFFRAVKRFLELHDDDGSWKKEASK